MPKQSILAFYFKHFATELVNKLNLSSSSTAKEKVAIVNECIISGLNMSKFHMENEETTFSNDLTLWNVTYNDDKNAIEITRNIKDYTLYNINDNKPYQCRYCDKRFKKLSRMKNHLNIHYGLKSHQCTKCMKKFTFKNGLTTHLRKKH